MNEAIKTYNESQALKDQAICNLLARVIDTELAGAESKIWHATRCGF